MHHVPATCGYDARRATPVTKAAMGTIVSVGSDAAVRDCAATALCSTCRDGRTIADMQVLSCFCGRGKETGVPVAKRRTSRRSSAARAGDAQVDIGHAEALLKAGAL